MILELRKHKSLAKEFCDYLVDFIHDYRVDVIVDMITEDTTIITIISFTTTVPLIGILDNKIFLKYLNDNNIIFIRFFSRGYFNIPKQWGDYFRILSDNFYKIEEVKHLDGLKKYNRKEKIKEILE
jgi:hypothetical protein